MHADKFEKLKAAAEEQHDGQALSMDAFVEDWNESQFWVCLFLFSLARLIILSESPLRGEKERRDGLS